jgi:hypothetical protein
MLEKCEKKKRGGGRSPAKLTEYSVVAIEDVQYITTFFYIRIKRNFVSGPSHVEAGGGKPVCLW